MAYATTERNRPATLAAVAALHVGAIYALVTGLAGPLLTIIEDRPLVGVHVPLPKQPPPETPKVTKPSTNPKTQPAAGPSDARQPVDTFPTRFTDDTVDFRLPPFDGDLGGRIGDLPPLNPTAETFTPKLARPIGKPGQWVTANDYPAHDLRADHEGTTRFQLSIGSDGKVQGCEITVSSGFPSLDAAACANLRKRGKFAPATGTNGTAVPGIYSSAVQWKIPKE